MNIQFSDDIRPVDQDTIIRAICDRLPLTGKYRVFSYKARKAEMKTLLAEDVSSVNPEIIRKYIKPELKHSYPVDLIERLQNSHEGQEELKSAIYSTDWLSDSVLLSEGGAGYLSPVYLTEEKVRIGHNNFFVYREG